MGIVGNIRNFFYAATHANELIADNQRMQQELAESKSIIEMQSKRLKSMYISHECTEGENINLRKELSLIRLHEALPQSLSIPPVGRIDYLSPNGKIAGCTEYESVNQFIKEIKAANFQGEPIAITIYSDSDTGKHIDTSWRLELDPPPHGFRIEPYNVASNLVEHFTRQDIADEIDFRTFSRVAVESTADYSDLSFHQEVVDGDIEERYRVVTSGGNGYHIAPMTRSLDSYEAAYNAAKGNPTLKIISYDELVKEVEDRRNVKNTFSDLSRYSTAQLQQALDQLDHSAAMEPPAPEPIPEPEFEIG